MAQKNYVQGTALLNGRFSISHISILLVYAFIFVMFTSGHLYSQGGEETYGSPQAIVRMNRPIGDATLSANFMVKIGLFYSLNSGGGISIAAGGWARNDYFQSSSNVSLNYIFYPSAIGNKDPEAHTKYRNLNKRMVNLSISTLLTVSLGGRTDWYYEEINPMYFGNRSGVYNSYQNAFTLGTTFITFPKGTYNNITSPRNRSQHLIFLQVKVGGQPSAYSEPGYFNTFMLNVCEDYLHDIIGPLADLRDRFYTGGGSAQIRLCDRILLKYYTETYTGNSYVDKQDYPDLVLPSIPRRGKSGKIKSLYERFAYQDAGQLGLNKARNFACIEYQGLEAGKISVGSGFVYANVEFFLGGQGGMWNAWSQHVIHNLVSVEKNKTVFDPEGTEKLHHFNFDYNPYKGKKAKLIMGLNFDCNTR